MPDTDEPRVMTATVRRLEWVHQGGHEMTVDLWGGAPRTILLGDIVEIRVVSNVYNDSPTKPSNGG